MKPRGVLLALALGALAGPAGACGVCLEDKMAVTYDDAVVKQAKHRGQVVVFAELLAPTRRDMERVRGAAARTRGVDPASVRASHELAAVSFALDARVASPSQALAAIAVRARLPATRLAQLRVLR